MVHKAGRERERQRQRERERERGEEEREGERERDREGERERERKRERKREREKAKVQEGSEGRVKNNHSYVPAYEEGLILTYPHLQHIHCLKYQAKHFPGARKQLKTNFLLAYTPSSILEPH